MKIRMENIPADSMVFMRRTGAYGEGNYQCMQDMKNWIQEHRLWRKNGVIYGIAWDNAATTPPEQCRYDVCFVTEETFKDAAIQYGNIPAGCYLVFEILHTADEVKHFWTSIENAVAKEGRQMDASRPVLERYAFALIEDGYCEFCVPVFLDSLQFVA